MTKPFLTIDLRPCGDDFVAHRQGHRVRETIAMRIAFGEITSAFLSEPATTCLRVEISDLPAHLIYPDGTIRTGRRHLLGLRDVLRDALQIEASDEIGSWHCDLDFHPVPGKPGHFLLDTWIADDISAQIAELSLDEIDAMLDDPRVTFDPVAITRS